MMASAGASRMSSVFGLKVRPRTAIVLPRDRAAERGGDALRPWRACGSSLTVDDGRRRCAAARRVLAGLDQRQRVLGEARAADSPGRHAGISVPMRLSRPMPRATSWTSAPTVSQRSAISLMKVILVARKALAAYLISSDVRRSVNSDRRLVEDRAAGRSRSSPRAPASSSVPTTIRSGRLKSSIAAPSRRNSGFETTAKSASGRSRRMIRSTSSPVPTGTVDLVTTTRVAVERRRDLACRRVDVGQVGMAVAAPARRADRDEHRVGAGDRRRRARS